MNLIYAKKQRQYRTDVASFFKIVLAVVILLLLVYFCSPLLIIGFLLLSIVPAIFVRFILMPARHSQRTILITLTVLSIATIYLTRINWVGITFFASLCATLIIVYFPQTAGSDDELLHNYSIFFAVVFLCGALIHALIYHDSPLKAAAEFIQLHLNSFQSIVDNAARSLSPEQAKDLNQQWETMRSYIPYYFYGSIFIC